MSRAGWELVCRHADERYSVKDIRGEMACLSELEGWERAPAIMHRPAGEAGNFRTRRDIFKGRHREMDSNIVDNFGFW
jgi:hypothetical protein